MSTRVGIPQTGLPTARRRSRIDARHRCCSARSRPAVLPSARHVCRHASAQAQDLRSTSRQYAPIAPREVADARAEKRKIATPDTPPVVINEGRWADWPAPADQMERARSFIREASVDRRACSADPSSASSGDPVIIVPDKDADGRASA